MRTRCLFLLPLAVATALAGCRKSSQLAATEAGARASDDETTVVPGAPPPRAGTETVAGLRVEGADPTFRWDPVAGADSYGVAVRAAGGLPWVWTGRETAVAFGSAAVEIPLPAALGPGRFPARRAYAKEGVEYRWSVDAYDAKGGLLAAGQPQTFRCEAPCGSLRPPPPPPAPPAAVPTAEPPPSAVVPSELPPLPPGVPDAAVRGLLGSIAEVSERPGFPAWHRLAAFTPDRLGACSATGPATGTTTSAMGMDITSATRSYATADGRRCDLSITGGDAAEIARMEFNVRLPDKTGDDHVRRRGESGGTTAILEWQRETGTAEARALPGDLYYVIVKVTPALSVDDAQALLGHVDLAGLAALR
jgi:hypothetical protein